MANTKIPVELSSTPSIVDNGDATAITIDSSESVGINYTTPSSMSAAANNLVVGSGASSDNTGLTIFANSNASASIHFADGTSGAAAYAGYIYYTHSGDFMGLGTGGTQRIRLDAHGLKFGADTAAANALDDYEEGTWTPTVNSGTITLVANSSEYTKIGDMVFAQTRITGWSDYTGTSHIVLGGLPYSVGTTQSHIGTGWGNFISNGKVTMYFYEGGGAYLGGTGYDPARHNILASDSNVIISLIYRHG